MQKIDKNQSKSYENFCVNPIDILILYHDFILCFILKNSLLVGMELWCLLDHLSTDVYTHYCLNFLLGILSTMHYFLNISLTLASNL